MLFLSDATIENVHWDASSVRDKLRNNIETHTNSIYNEKISQEAQELKNITLQNQAGNVVLYDVLKF